jgi:phenylacetic acid degradation operon negative regulatory protein
MLRSGAERIYGFGAPWEWDGRWLLVVLRVPEERREVRHQLRTRLAWAGFGSLGGGVWITPHVSHEEELRGATANGTVAALVSFQAEMGRLGDPGRVIAEAWDLDTVADHYRQFIADFGRVRPSSPEATFRAQTAMVHAWRKFPFLDPDLPAQLLPRGWPLRRAHDLFHERHDRWHDGAQAYFRSLDP